MYARSLKPFAFLITLMLLVGMACNFGSSETPAPQVQETQPPQETVEPVKTEAPVETETPQQVETSGSVSDLQSVKSAVIQIESQGTFIDPQVGLVLNGAGRGSGFIIDPSGIAVTNNHVVTGAALLKVWVGGETQSRNAKVLGVSECSDLAVIDIDGEGFDYLDWYSGDIDVGMDMYIAGFPLGDPEYTLNKGIISKAKAGGETSWSSVDSVLEYDAVSNPGNSGGPVVTPDGQVLAVHYAGNAGTRQAFGISRDVARSVIEQLRSGQNVDTVGVNGQAVGTEDGSLTGIWVSSVQSGSPADRAGLEAGDIVTMMEDLILATDGTMSDYCDILRSHSPGDALSMQVLRWSTGEVLEGQLNGRELEVTYVSSDPGTEDPGTSTGGTGVNTNATQSGDIMYETDFFDTENWYTFGVPDVDTYEASHDGEVVYIQVDSVDTTIYMVYDYFFPADVRVDAAVETVAGPNRNNISLLCRASDQGWYEFSMNSGGLWYIWKYDNSTYTRLANGGSNSINLKKASNEITATCIGNRLSLYVNQVEMGSVTDNTFRDDGQVGVSVSTFDLVGAGVEFDWFVASVP